MQSNSVKALEVVLRDQLAAGASIFQGCCPSPPLEMLLKQRMGNIVPHFVDLRDQKSVIEYRKEDQVISLETGINTGELKAILLANNQYLPCFTSDDTTLLEIINSAETGYFEHSFGLRVLVLGLEVLLSSGDRIKTGGKVVKNVSGYDLTKLFLGAHGTLGIPVKAHLRVYARPELTETFVASGLALESLLELATELIKSGLNITGLDLVTGHRSPQDSVNLPALQQGFLLITVSEHADVMSELAPLLEGHCQRLKATVTKLGESARVQVMTSLEDQFAAAFTALSLSASRSRFRKIYPALVAAGAKSMLYRPGTGRLKLSFDTVEERRSGLAMLAEMSGEPFEVAYADDEFEHRVERLPQSDSEIESIKRELKQSFDPPGCMNPLAKL